MASPPTSSTAGGAAAGATTAAPPAIHTLPPITHAIGGSLGSALALGLLYPLERTRIEMQAAAAARGGERRRLSSSSAADPSPLQQEEQISTSEAAEDSTTSAGNTTASPTRKNNAATVDNDGNTNPGGSSSPSSSSEGSWTKAPQNPPLSHSAEIIVEVTTSGKVQQSQALPGPLPPPVAAAAVADSSGELRQLQKQPPQEEHQATKKLGLIECFEQLWIRNELYRGFGPIVSTLATSNFIFFYVNALMKRLVVRNNRETTTTASHYSSYYRTLVASCLAGIVNVVVTNPLWVANLRIVTGEAESSNLLTEMKAIAKDRGYGHLWSGTTTSILLVSNPVIQFFAYEQLRNALLLSRTRRRPKSAESGGGSAAYVAVNLDPIEAFLAGALAKAISTVLTYPLQLAQAVLRMQKRNNTTTTSTTGATDKGQPSSGNSHGVQQYRGTLDCLIQLYSQDGLQGLFTGMRAKLLQTVLTAAFTFLTYEQILHAVYAAQQALLRRRNKS